jgi:hypothetical protein
VAHAFNPNYSGGRDQEDHSLRPVWVKALSQKNPSQKKAGRVVQGVGSEFIPHCTKIKENKKCIIYLKFKFNY